MNRSELKQYLHEIYHTEADCPWANDPDSEVFRHADNQKWFALLLKIPIKKLGIPTEAVSDVVNLKCDPILIGGVREENGIFPAYHMNKAHWITVLLDGSVPDEKIKMLIDMSYAMTAAKSRT